MGGLGKSLQRATAAGLAWLAVTPTTAAPPSPVLATFAYEGKGKLQKTYAGMDFTIDAIGPPDIRGPRLRVAIDGKPAFKLQLRGESGNGSATVKIVRLDGDGPQIFFEHFTYGAHCCMGSKIATRVDGHWMVVLGDSLDGDGGYEFKDIDGSGVGELVSSDRSFLYKFTGYAGSLAPIQIQKLEGAKLVDVTRDPRFAKAVRDSLAAMEKAAQADDNEWENNGFLAAWVATKVLLDEGPAAWKQMLKTFNPGTDWPMTVCPGAANDDCPEDKKRVATFPEALRVHLMVHGYIKDLSTYPLPPEASK